MDISVIIAVYNVKDYLSDCIESLIKQDLINVEFILVDDGSTDGSSLICDRAELSDKRIKVVHKENGGLSDARNAGLSVATGEYVMFLDGDDLLDIGTLSILSKIAKQIGADLFQYGYRELSSPECFAQAKFYGEIDVVRDRKEMYARLLNIGGEAASGCTKLIKRSLLTELKFPKGRLHEDEFFTTELLDIVQSVVYLSRFKPYQYIKRAGSIINSAFNPKRVYDKCDMYQLRLEKLRRLGFTDIEDSFKARFMEDLYVQYIRSKNNKHKDCMKFVNKQITKIQPIKRCGLSLELKLLQISPSRVMPMMYAVRRILGRHKL